MSQYLVIENFNLGLDRRRHILALPPGSLYELKNGHISRGGEIEKRKAFVSKYALPAGTFGMQGVGSALYVFGSGANPGVPAGVTYQRLQHPDGLAMTGMVDAVLFNNLPYVLARFSDNIIVHFYNGSIVHDWIDGVVRIAMANNNGIATHLAGTFSTDPDYSAVAAANVVTITGPVNVPYTATATALNGGAANDQTASVVVTQASGGGLPQIVTVTIGGTFEVGDKFTIQLVAGATVRTFGAGRPNGSQALAIRTLKDKVYAGASTNLLGSGVKVPTGWNSEDIGSFITDMSGQVDQFDAITGLGTFLNNLAILARRATQIWSVDPDPSLNAQLQVMPNIGTVAGRSVISYADSDLFFLSDTGIRSLRSHQFFNIATKSDIGTPIDPLVITAMTALGATVTSQAVGTIDPSDGRYWLALGGVIYVFSYFPDSKISAWSTYDNGMTFTDFAILGNRLYARSGNTIYLYGGDDNATYDTSVMQIRLPFLSAKMLATVKHFLGIDLTTQGEFTIYIASDPNQPDVDEEVAVLSGSTFGVGIVPVNAESEMFSLRLTHSKAEYAKLVHAVVHYAPVVAG